MAEMTTDAQGGSTPRPDPTLLTTQQLLRELGLQGDRFDAALAATEKVISTRLDGMDKAIELSRLANDRQAALATKEVENLTGLLDEKFQSVQRQFENMAALAKQVSESATVAINAALQAQKEAVAEQTRASALSIAKSEKTFGEQIGAQATLIQTVDKGFGLQMGDVKERLTRLEGQAVGAKVAQDDGRGNIALVVSVITGLVVIIGLVVTLLGGRVPVK